MTYDTTPHSAARAGLVALQVLAGAAIMLAGALLFWGVLSGVGVLAQLATDALGIAPASAVYSRLFASAELWRQGATALLVLMVVLALAMTAIAAGQGLLTLGRLVRSKA